MKKMRLLLFTFLLCTTSLVFGQNLVLNPSFETISSCPIGPGEFFRATSWFDANANADSCSSPDLVAGCAPGIGGVNSPSMLIGYQPSRTGSNHAGLILYEAVFAFVSCLADDYREYIEGQLSSPMVAGQTYCVSFYINKANDAQWAVDKLGVYFSNSLVNHPFTCPGGSVMPFTPQLVYTGPAITDTLNWVRVQWNYTATGGETHFVIGNFATTAATTASRVGTCGFAIHPYAYYFIDDVSIVPNACTVVCPTINVTANVSNVSCGSTNNGAIDMTPAGGQTPYTYIWSNGATTQDLASLVAGAYNVTVSDANSCTATFSATVSSAPGLSISPNPTNVSCNGGNNGVAAVNVSGGSGSYTYTWGTAATTAAISGLAAGTYPVTVSSGGAGSTTDTLYQQDFAGTHNWTLNVATGANSATPQEWTVNAEEGGGILPPGCGVANNGNNSLHISCTSFGCAPPFNFITGAVYNATQETNRRAESPVFSTVGYTGITLSFNFIANGDGLLDNASLLYNDGSGWQVLNPSLKSIICSSGQGQWTNLTVVLPASCNNNANVRIAFNWTNNGDNIGTDPSIAVDNIVVTSPGTGGPLCAGTQTVTITAPSAVTTSNVLTNASCGNANGTVNLTVLGGTGAYSYIWSNGSTIQDIAGLAAGTYTVTVADANNCSVTAAATVTATAGFTLNSTSTNASCAGSNGTVNLNITSGTAPFTFVWNTGATTQNLTGLAAGSYTVTVSDAAACSATSSVNVSSTSSSTVTVASVTNVTCNAGTNGAVDITAISPPGCSSPVVHINEILTNVTGGTADGDGSGCGSLTAPLSPLSAEFIELIGPPGTNIGCYVLTDGDWTITIPPSTLIPADGIFTIGNNNTPLHIGNGTTFDLNVNSCGCFTDSCQLLIFTNGGEYLAVFNSTGTFVDGLIYGAPSGGNSPTPGTVIPTRGLSGCVSSVTLPALSAFTTFGTTPAEGNSTIRNPDGTGTYSTTATNSPNACNAPVSSTFTYQWSNGATTQDLTGLAAGVYTVTVTDASGCPTIRSVTVTQPSAVTLTTAATATTCSNNSNGTATVAASGGTAGYTFVWSNTATTATITGLAAGVYTVTSSDANSCTSTSSVTVTSPSAVSVTGTVNNIACTTANIGGINLSVSGGTAAYTFVWSNAATTQNISGLAVGNYSVTVSDANSCSATYSASVTASPGLQVDATGTDVNCNGAADGCASVIANGGTAPYTYIWSNGQTADNFCNLAPGTYIVTVNDAGAGGNLIDTVYQEGFQAVHNWTLNVATGVNGVDNNFWVVNDNEGGVLPPGCGLAGNGDRTLHITSVFFPAGGAAYDAGGLCGTLFCPQTNMRAESPVFSTVGFNNLSLKFDFISNGQALLDNASVFYNSGTGWTQLVNSIKSPVCGSGQGQWTNFTVALPASCNNNPTVQVAFNWTNNDDGVGTDPSVAINNVLVFESNSVVAGCSGTDTIVISQPTALATNTVSITNANCSTPGAVNIAVNGGTAPYSFLWSNGATTEDITGVNAGSYSVTITDANACTIVNAANTVNATTAPVVSLGTSSSPSCNGDADGSITASVVGGTAPYTFVWTAGQTGSTATGLSAGVYSVTTTDASGCTATVAVTLTEPSAIVISNISVTAASCADNDAAISFGVSGGAGGYTYQWSNGRTNQNLNNIPSGNYTVTVTDADGCEQSSSQITVSVAGSITVQVDGVVNESCVPASAGGVNITATGGSGSFTYLWSNGATTEDLTGVGIGTYSVTVNDTNGCIDSTAAVVNTSFVPTLAAFVGQTGIIDSSIALGQSINVNVGNDQTAQGVTYLWTSIPNTANFVATTAAQTTLAPTPAGIYTLIVTATSADGCTDVDTLTLNVISSNPQIPTAFSPNGDAQNETFSVVDLNKEYLVEFKVFNRWGQLVYDNATEGNWDGKVNGTEQPREVYMYIITWQRPNDVEPVVNRGTITLLR